MFVFIFQFACVCTAMRLQQSVQVACCRLCHHGRHVLHSRGKLCLLSWQRLLHGSSPPDPGQVVPTGPEIIVSLSKPQACQNLPNLNAKRHKPTSPNHNAHGPKPEPRAKLHPTKPKTSKPALPKPPSKPEHEESQNIQTWLRVKIPKPQDPTKEDPCLKRAAVAAQDIHSG